MQFGNLSKFGQGAILLGLSMSPHTRAINTTRAAMLDVVQPPAVDSAQERILGPLQQRFGTELINSLTVLTLSERQALFGRFRLDISQIRELYNVFVRSDRMLTPDQATTNREGPRDARLRRVKVEAYFDEVRNTTFMHAGNAIDGERKKIDRASRNLMLYAWTNILTPEQKTHFAQVVDTLCDSELDHGIIEQVYRQTLAEFQSTGKSHEEVIDETKRRLESYIRQFLTGRLSREEWNANIVNLPRIGTDNPTIRPLARGIVMTQVIIRYIHMRVEMMNLGSGNSNPESLYSAALLFLEGAADFAYRPVIHIPSHYYTAGYIANAAIVDSFALPLIGDYFDEISRLLAAKPSLLTATTEQQAQR